MTAWPCDSMQVHIYSKLQPCKDQEHLDLNLLLGSSLQMGRAWCQLYQLLLHMRQLQRFPEQICNDSPESLRIHLFGRWLGLSKTVLLNSHELHGSQHHQILQNLTGYISQRTIACFPPNFLCFIICGIHKVRERCDWASFSGYSSHILRCPK